MRPVFAATLLPLGLAAAQLSGPADGEPQAYVVRDLLDEFPQATVHNCADARVNPLARANAEVMPALALHPPGQGDGEVAFAPVPVPPCPERQQAFLLLHLGMSDGIPWGGPRQPNGVRFTVLIEDEEALTESVAETGWFLRLVDLTPWAGKSVRITLRTNAIDGNAAYDWALVGRPRLVLFQPATAAEPTDRTAAALALVPVRVTQDSAVEVVAGSTSACAKLTSGTHVLPLSVPSWATLEVRAEPGPVTVASVHWAPWAYRVEAVALGPETGFVTVGQPFAMVLSLRNVGEGSLPAGRELRLRLSRLDGSPLPGVGPELSAVTPALAPGDEGAVRWPAVTAGEAGDLQVSVALDGGQESGTIRVYPAEPALPAGRPRRAQVRIDPEAGRWGTVANPWCRLTVVLADGADGYALADTWNGTAWERAASLYPLFRVVAASTDATGTREALHLTLSDLRRERGGLVLSGTARADSGAAWPLRLTLTPEGKAPRICLTAEAEPPGSGGQLLAFAGPTVLAGDRSYGAAKDFALFPGLEYLEGPEPSSSTRDLAPPLHERRTPFAWKIACPVMAVQGRGTLTALAWNPHQEWTGRGLPAARWDPHQEWTPGHRLPAARFVCPPLAAGPQYSHLSLFVPGVGDGTPEHGDEATTPVALAPNQTVRLESWLVLDHAARYPADSVVNGPHRGGLITQAVQHWFELFGLPEPSPPPRSWEAQRDLSREPYLTTLWQAEPPGWSLTVGEPARAHSDLAAPLLLDLQAGLPATLEQEVLQRVDRVLERARADGGLVVPVHGNSPLLQYQFGDVPEALAAHLGNARGQLSARRNGVWVWQPGDREHARLGIPGSHTLGQAAYPSLVALRAALYAGDAALAREALEALRQMEQYEVPRGASMWECPQFQPDIFAAALAIRAYCVAYHLTGDGAHLAQARYWAWTGLSFLYTWQLEGYPTMLYNSVGVKGSTFFTHSWIGRPVVWMGLDYAYALQDLAELDASFDWRRVAAGITASAQWQQYTEGPSRGCYPDSWEMASNRPNPVDINPILIQLNAFRLRGQSLEVRSLRLPGTEGPVSLCSGADLAAVRGSPAKGQLSFRLAGVAESPVYSSLAQVPRPARVEGVGESCADSAALAAAPQGWLYHEPTRCLVIRHGPEPGRQRVTLAW